MIIEYSHTDMMIGLCFSFVITVFYGPCGQNAVEYFLKTFLIYVCFVHVKILSFLLEYVGTG